MLGCGMVHPAVFEAVGYDAEQYTGLRVRRRHRAPRAAALRHRRHPDVLRERPAVPRAAARCEAPAVAGCASSSTSRPMPPSSPRGSPRAASPSRAIDGDVIDFEITANRPDCLSVYGLAREAATAFDLPLRRSPSESTASTCDPRPRADHGLDRRRRLRPVRARGRRRPVGPSPDWLARSPARRGRAADQQRRRRHQLRDARDGPPDARVRRRRSSPGPRFACAGRARASG